MFFRNMPKDYDVLYESPDSCENIPAEIWKGADPQLVEQLQADHIEISDTERKLLHQLGSYGLELEADFTKLAEI